MPGAVNCELLLYADDTCIIFQGKDVADIQKKLTENFSTLCDLFVDNKLSIHLGEDKTKCILFSGNLRPQNYQLHIAHGETTLIQNKYVTYLGCKLDQWP